MSAAQADPETLLAPFRDDPAGSALLTDVDGTLAPIVDDPAAAAPLPEAREALASLAERHGLVACVSGRPAADARRIVGLDDLVYLGNHGLERLDPGASEARPSAALAGHEEDAPRFVAALDDERLPQAGIRVEMKGPIRALHWRGAADEERAAGVAEEIAGEAERAGLAIHHGRKVIELRPPVEFDKGMAIAELLIDRPVRHALYAGDDRTDLDAFRVLRDLVASGVLETAVCVAIAADESPPEVSAQADFAVASPAEFAALLSRLVA